jgi:hypothetical protein
VLFRSVGLTQRQVYHRCKKGDIQGEKYGWVWMIPFSELARVVTTDWYKASKKSSPIEA